MKIQREHINEIVSRMLLERDIGVEEYKGLIVNNTFDLEKNIRLARLKDCNINIDKSRDDIKLIIKQEYIDRIGEELSSNSLRK